VDFVANDHKSGHSDISTYDQTIWIARHGNRIDFVNPGFNTAERRYDPPLPRMAVQAPTRATPQREDIAHIFASPFLRTVQTANQVAEALDLPIKLESGLSEWLNSAWMTDVPERLSMEALTELFLKLTPAMLLALLLNIPGEQALKRAGETAKLLADEFRRYPTGGSRCISTGCHNGVGGIAKTEVEASCAAW